MMIVKEGMLMSKDQRLTKQKTAILEILRSSDSHPTAEWIYQEARKELPELSMGTVYRNLHQMRDNGEILELRNGKGQSHFDGWSHNHYHFRCKCCGGIWDLPLPAMKTLEAKAKVLEGFQIEGHRLEFYGLCEECRRR
jgi:Fur family ferric uptake transcriptional regulator/Fur family peroxide stress response transcriptional regulator